MLSAVAVRLIGMRGILENGMQCFGVLTGYVHPSAISGYTV